MSRVDTRERSGCQDAITSGIDSMKKRLMVRPSACIGCRSCELICSYRHKGEFSSYGSAVSVYEFNDVGMATPLMCMQCEEAQCLSACRFGALSRDEITEAVVYNRDKCVLCGMCTKSCALGGISYDKHRESMIKCVLCDGSPQCAMVCPVSAIDFTEMQDDE